MFQNAPAQPILLENWQDIFGNTLKGEIYLTQELFTELDSPQSFGIILKLLEETRFLHNRHLSTTLEILERTQKTLKVLIRQRYMDSNRHIPEQTLTYGLCQNETWSRTSMLLQSNIDSPVKSRQRHLFLLWCCRLLERKYGYLGNKIGITTMDIEDEGNVAKGYYCTIVPLSPEGSYSVKYRFRCSVDLKYLMQIPEW